ncbi:MAG: NAD(P)-binding domain-containing protein [Sphingomicrobium sp.]
MTTVSKDASIGTAASGQTYAIIGSGKIGRALAHQFARSAKPVLVANHRGPATVAPLRDDFGDSITPASIEDALRADIVIMAVPFAAVPEVAQQVGDWQGRILVDATNAINFADFSPIDLGGKPSTQLVADAVPTARVVKCFNTLAAAVLEADPAGLPGKRVTFLSGNSPEAVADVAQLATHLGFAPIVLGRTDQGGLLAEFGGPLVLKNFVEHA